MSVQIATVSSFADLEGLDYDQLATDCNCPSCLENQIMNDDAAIEREFTDFAFAQSDSPAETLRFTINELLNGNRLQQLQLQFEAEELAREEKEEEETLRESTDEDNRAFLPHSHPKPEGMRKAAHISIPCCDRTLIYRPHTDWRRKQNGTRSSEWKREQNRNGRSLRRKFAAQEAQDWHEDELMSLSEMETLLAEEWREYEASEAEDAWSEAEYEERRADYWKYDCSSWRLNELLYWAGKPMLDNDEDDAITVRDDEGNHFKMFR